MKVIGIAGWKNSGKTTLAERLVAEFVRRGLRVGAVKHAHHDFDTDREGTDSWRHRKAGAARVAVVSDRRVATIEELGDRPEPALHEILSGFAGFDLVVVEGYKREAHAKIETRRREARDTGPLGAPNVVAIAADHAVAAECPVFALDDVAAIADFIESLPAG